MIAQRFRSLGWAAGVATAATGLYLISLQVAAERGKLDAVERQIATAQRDMRALQTELGTRGSLRQLEKYNGDVLSMTAPRARQFLASEAQLASFDAESLDDKAGAPAVMAASFTQPAPSAPTEAQPAAPRLQHATYQKPAEQPRLQPAVYQKPSERPHVERVAMLDTGSLGDIARTADEERRTRP